jgi:hypothetical protein
MSRDKNMARVFHKTAISTNFLVYISTHRVFDVVRTGVSTRCNVDTDKTAGKKL